MSYISLCVNFPFILNTLHCDAYWRDGVVKFQTQPQKLHTSATFCRHLLQKLDYCLLTNALKIKQMVPLGGCKVLNRTYRHELSNSKNYPNHMKERLLSY